MLRKPSSPRTHGRHFCKVSHPPTSTVALTRTIADHRPCTVLSWRRVEIRVRYLWMATEASEDDALTPPEAWVDERRVLQLARDAAMAGTCWGSCDVGVEEMRNVRARNVASSVVTGAMLQFRLLSLASESLFLSPGTSRRSLMHGKKFTVSGQRSGRDALNRQGWASESLRGTAVSQVSVNCLRPWQA